MTTTAGTTARADHMRVVVTAPPRRRARQRRQGLGDAGVSAPIPKPPARHHQAVADQDEDVAPHLHDVRLRGEVATPVHHLVDQAVDERQDRQHQRGHGVDRSPRVGRAQQHAARDPGHDDDVVNQRLATAQRLLVDRPVADGVDGDRQREDHRAERNQRGLGRQRRPRPAAHPDERPRGEAQPQHQADPRQVDDPVDAPELPDPADVGRDGGQR